ncbi:hypothetical protein HYH03_005340 [Edaphochlamys debaryana]|uniref:RNA 3'-terminal phosphate cyclase n=1 Tax=Edaphochlamys debaryana TaxID=47281 RepID=A0A835Y5R5_9CHLO|nr:hypothetical protein HYH03_005340 [Edaphochlamys debaryana]|eukprot:KAG2496516.1 hypothetical protein HYH03_005340 [Edaphochlamys debaryana]
MEAGMRVVDGSMLEGGGQILRNASALAALTGWPLRVDAIRAKRSRPGLQPQHLTGLRLVEGVCGGQLAGGEVGSCSITLRPGPGSPRCGRYSADTRTAGSCTLMVQAAMPVCVFAEPPPPADNANAVVGPSGRPCCHLELRGGTDADMAPPAGYLTDVLAPLLKRLYGDLMSDLDVKVVRRGFYPKGQGVLEATLPALPPGARLPPISLTDRGKITQVTIHAFSAGRLPPHVAQRMAAAAEAALRRGLRRVGAAAGGVTVPIAVEAVVEPPERAFGDGCGILLFADTDTGCRLGASAKGERGVPAEEVGERAAAELLDALESGACVDQWMQDQLVVWMALGSGTSRVAMSPPSLHTRTAMVVAEALLPGVRFRLRRPGAAGDEAAEAVGGSEGEEGVKKGGGSGAAGGGGKGKKGKGGKGGGGGGREEGYGQESPYEGGVWLVECDGAGWTVGRRGGEAAGPGGEA